MNKKIRLEKIRKFVTDYQIGTQEEIVEYLKEAGISATQATVSRDIKELGIVKIHLKNNTYIYELPKSVVKSMQLAENNIVHSERLGQMINLQIVPGNTLFVKSQLLEVFSEKLFSCIADDNSILMVLRTEEEAKEVFEQVKNW